MARIKLPRAQAAEALTEDEPLDWSRVYYLGAHPQSPGGTEGTPYQPQARVFPNAPRVQEEEFIFDPDVLEVAAPAPRRRPDTRPRYEPAYPTSPTMGKALETARAQEGGLVPAGEFLTGAAAGAASGLGGLLEAQAAGALGIVDEETDKTMEEWGSSVEEQEAEIKKILASDPDLLESLQREASDIMAIFSSGDEAPPERPQPPGVRQIKRQAPVSPGKTGEVMGGALLQGILADSGLMLNDFKAYGEAFPLATAMTISPALLNKLLKAGGKSAGKIKDFQKAVREKLDTMEAQDLEYLRRDTRRLTNEADNAADEADALGSVADEAGSTPGELRSNLEGTDLTSMAKQEVKDVADKIAASLPDLPDDPLVMASKHADTRKRLDQLTDTLGLSEVAKNIGTDKKTLKAALEKAQGLLDIRSGVSPGGKTTVAVLPSDAFTLRLNQARSGETILTDVEQFAALMYSKFLEDNIAQATTNMANDLKALGQRPRGFGNKKWAEDVKNIKDGAGELIKEDMGLQRDLLEALDVSGSSWGRAGRGRQAALEMFQDLSETSVVNRATVAKGAPLTDKELASVTKMYGEGSTKKGRGKKAVKEADEAIKAIDKELEKRLPGKDRRRLKGAKKTWQKRKAKGTKDASEGAQMEMAAAVIGPYARTKALFGLSRSLNAMMDLSAIGRQGIGLLKEHPIIGAKAFFRSVAAGFNTGYAQALQRKMLTRVKNGKEVSSGFADYANRAKLFMADVEGIAGTGGTNRREEMFVDAMLLDANILPSVFDPVKGGAKMAMGWSERTYNTVLNQMRGEIFDKWTRLDDQGAFMTKKFYDGDIVFDKEGIPRVSNKDAKEMARIINLSTGRGDLMEALPFGKGRVQGRQARKINSWLGTVFFAPRFATSRALAPATTAFDGIVGLVKTVKPGSKPSTKQIRQMTRILKQQAANAAMTQAAAMMFTNKTPSEALYDFWDQSGDGFMAITIPGDWGEGDYILDTSGGIGSTYRYLPAILKALEEGKVSDARTGRLIMNKVIGPIGALISMATGKNFKGDTLGEGYAAWSLDWMARRFAEPGLQVITPIIMQELIGGFIEDSALHGVMVSRKEAGEVLGPLAANFFGLSTYQRDPE